MLTNRRVRLDLGGSSVRLACSGDQVLLNTTVGGDVLLRDIYLCFQQRDSYAHFRLLPAWAKRLADKGEGHAPGW